MTKVGTGVVYARFSSILSLALLIIGCLRQCLEHEKRRRRLLLLLHWLIILLHAADRPLRPVYCHIQLLLLLADDFRSDPMRHLFLLGVATAAAIPFAWFVLNSERCLFILSVEVASSNGFSLEWK